MYSPESRVYSPSHHFCVFFSKMTTAWKWKFWNFWEFSLVMTRHRKHPECNKISECSWFDQIHWFLIYNTSAQYQFVILWQILQYRWDWQTSIGHFGQFWTSGPFWTKSFEWCGPSRRFLVKCGHLAKIKLLKNSIFVFWKDSIVFWMSLWWIWKHHAWIYELLVL